MSRNQKPSILTRGFVVSHYRLVRQVGQGGYGFIYIVTDIEDNIKYAMKIEKIQEKKRGLNGEIEIMRQLEESPYLPKFHDAGEDKGFRFIVMELLGPSVSAIRFLMHKERFHKFTGFKISIEMLKCIREYHRQGLIHRDIKPGNFLFRPNSEYPITLIDFGLSRYYIDKSTGAVLPPRENVGFVGTGKYASINAHSGAEQSKKDDLISWFYASIELVSGSLPWPLTRESERLVKSKTNTPLKKLCKRVPDCFMDLFNYLDQLDFYDEPDYDMIIDTINGAIDNICEKKKSKGLDYQKITRKKLKKVSAINILQTDDQNDIECFANAPDYNGAIPLCNVF